MSLSSSSLRCRISRFSGLRCLRSYASSLVSSSLRRLRVLPIISVSSRGLKSGVSMIDLARQERATCGSAKMLITWVLSDCWRGMALWMSCGSVVRMSLVLAGINALFSTSFCWVSKSCSSRAEPARRLETCRKRAGRVRRSSFFFVGLSWGGGGVLGVWRVLGSSWLRWCLMQGSSTSISEPESAGELLGWWSAASELEPGASGAEWPFMDAGGCLLLPPLAEDVEEKRLANRLAMAGDRVDRDRDRDRA